MVEALEEAVAQLEEDVEEEEVVRLLLTNNMQMTILMEACFTDLYV